MSQSANKIEMNYQNILGKAEELMALADKISNLTESELDSVSISVSRNWTGSSANSYQKKINKLRANMEAEAVRLRKLSGYLKESAKRTYEVEKRGMALFSRKG